MARWNEDLNPRQQKFVRRYVKHGNATRAYIEAGYETATKDIAASAAANLLGNMKIAVAIERLQNRAAQRAEVDIADCLAEYKKMGFSDMREHAEWSADTVTLRSSEELPRRVTGAVKRVKQTEIELKDGIIKRTLELELHDKKGALDSIMRHLGGFAADKLEVTGKNGGPLEVDVSTMTPEQRRARIAELRAKFDDKPAEEASE